MTHISCIEAGRTFACTAIYLIVLTACQTEQWPYDEQADAAKDVARGIAEAKVKGNHLMLIFGANWCPDCRELDAAMQDKPLTSLIERNFTVVKIDIGDWDKHPAVVAAWGNPIEGGIPAMVVATPAGEILHATKDGELATARNMSREMFHSYFQQLVEFIND